MHFGASMFFTDYSMTSVELAQALEARGFESIWAPEHSHIPTSRRSPVARRYRPRTWARGASNGLPPGWICPFKFPALPDMPHKYSNLSKLGSNSS